MLTQIDHTATHEIQKVTKPNGKLIRYQVVELPHGNSETVKVFMTLEHARTAIGKTANGRALQ